LGAVQQVCLCMLVSELDPSFGEKGLATSFIRVVPMSECWHYQSDSLIANGVMEMVSYQASVSRLITYGRSLCFTVSLLISGGPMSRLIVLVIVALPLITNCPYPSIFHVHAICQDNSMQRPFLPMQRPFLNVRGVPVVVCVVE